MLSALYSVDFALLPNIPRLQFTKVIFFASEIKKERKKKNKTKVLLLYPGKLQVVYRRPSAKIGHASLVLTWNTQEYHFEFVHFPLSPVQSKTDKHKNKTNRTQ